MIKDKLKYSGGGGVERERNMHQATEDGLMCERDKCTFNE